MGLAALSVAVRARGFDTWLLLARADGFAVGGILAAILADKERVARRLIAIRRGLMIMTLLALTVVIVAMANGVLPPIRRPEKGAAFAVLAINLVLARRRRAGGHPRGTTGRRLAAQAATGPHRDDQLRTLCLPLHDSHAGRRHPRRRLRARAHLGHQRILACPHLCGGRRVLVLV